MWVVEFENRVAEVLNFIRCDPESSQSVFTIPFTAIFSVKEVILYQEEYMVVLYLIDLLFCHITHPYDE